MSKWFLNSNFDADCDLLFCEEFFDYQQYDKRILTIEQV